MEEAKKLADSYNLDLVEVRPNVCKILNAGKLKYELNKRRIPKAKPVKEMKFKLHIGEPDFLVKTGHIRRFLENGSQVKVTIWFSGREVSRPQDGVDLMERIAAAVEEVGKATLNNSIQSRNMTMVIVPCS